MKKRGFDPAERALLKQLHADDETTRSKAADAIRALGPRAVPMLRCHSREEGATYRAHVLDLLGELHPDGLVPAAIEGLASDDPHEQWQMCNVLRDLAWDAHRGTAPRPGRDPRPAVPALLDVARSASGMNQSRAWGALTAMGGETMASLLDEYLKPELPDSLAEEIAANVGDFFSWDEIDESEKLHFIDAVARVARDPRLHANGFQGWVKDALATAGPNVRSACAPIRAIAADPAHPFRECAREALVAIDADPAEPNSV